MVVLSIEKAIKDEQTDTYRVSGKIALGIYSKTIIEAFQRINDMQINNFVTVFENMDFYKLCCILRCSASCAVDNGVTLLVNDAIPIQNELKGIATKYYKMHC